MPTVERLIRLLAVVAMLMSLGGCHGGLADIDRRTQRLMEGRSAAMGGAVPRVGFSDDTSERKDRRAGVAKQIPTVNPGAGDLRYLPADEARDVSAKLEAYASALETPPPEAVPLNLQGAFRTAQETGREYRTAEEEYILAAVRLLIQRHLWDPRLFNTTTASISGQGTDGDFRSALNVLNELRVTQKLPYGGDLSARWITQATEQLREEVTGRYRQSSRIVLDANIPLLRGGGLIAQEALIQAERDLIYQARTFEDFRRQFLVSIAGDYFDLDQRWAQIGNAKRQLAGFEVLQRGNEARVEAGRLAEFEANISRNNLLSAQADLAAQREQYLLALDRFKVRLGMPVDTPVVLEPVEFEIPEPTVGLDEASSLALDYRLDLQTRRDQLDDARRGVRNARNGVLPDLNLGASATLPTDPDEKRGGVSLSPDDLIYTGSVTFGLPLDRENERLALRSALISLGAREREYQRLRDQAVIDSRQSVRNVDLARFRLELASRRVEINQRRREELELKADTVDTQTRVNADNDLRAAEDARDQARTSLRNAILNYLLQTGQLRAARDGTFQRLPGMDAQPLPPPVNPEGPPPQTPPPELPPEEAAQPAPPRELVPSPNLPPAEPVSPR